MDCLNISNKVIFVCILCCFGALVNADVEVLTEDNWQAMLEGEWLVDFFAPWCPACKSLSPTWQQVGQHAADLRIHFALIDVTENPVLSGRFFITALPTIYHVKDGVFRLYKGQRSSSDIVSFLRDEQWKNIDPLPWYWSPTSTHMAAVGVFFQLSITIRNVHNTMTTDYGIPVWGSYIIFAVATILLGLLIGLVIVCLCDAVHMSRHRQSPVARQSGSAMMSRVPGSGDAVLDARVPAAGAALAGGQLLEDDDDEDTGEFDLREDEVSASSPVDDVTAPPPGSGDSPTSTNESSLRRRDTTKQTTN